MTNLKERNFTEQAFERLQLGKALPFSKIQDITDRANVGVIGKAECGFYNTQSLICNEFYKPISRVISKNDI